MQEPIVVACASNAAYVIPLAVMLRSIVHNLDPERQLTVYVIDDGIDDCDKRRLSESLPERVAMHWLSPLRSGFDGLPLWGRMPITTYDKLMIADVLPDSVHKAIWLDCDMLVLDDLAKLWAMPTAGKHALAVVDSLVPCVSSRFGVTGFRDEGLAPTAPYFNAGMMVIDTTLWRRDRTAQRALEYLRKYRERVFFWDQEALNAVLSGLWNVVDPQWNWSANLIRLSASRHDETHVLPSIMHFNGNLKPWLVAENGTIGSLYSRTLAETAWKDWRPPQTSRSRILSWYGSSWLRKYSYPAEQWGMQFLWRFTKR